MGFFHFLQVAEQQFSVVVSEVHAAAFAVAPVLAVFAEVGFHPVVVAVWQEALFPDLYEVVCVDVALLVVMADACAGADASVDEDGGRCDAGCAAEHPVAHVAFVWSEEAFAAVGGVYVAFFACLADEVEQSSELFCCELEVFVLCASADGEDGCEPPVCDAFADEVVAQLWQGVVVVLVYAGHDVVDERRVVCNHVDCLACHAEAVGVSAQPGVLFLQSVEADGYGAESGVLEFAEHFGCE